MLKPELVAFDVAAVDDLEQLRPELALEQDGRARLPPPPQRAQRRFRRVERDRVGPQLDPHRGRVGRQRDLQRQRAVEPGQELARFVGIENCILDRDEGVALSGEYSPKPTVGSDAYEWLTGLLFAVAKVVGHFALDVRPLADQILLGLENGAPDQRICAAFHLYALLEVNLGKRDIEPGDKNASKICLHLVMARLAGEMAEDFE